MSPPRKIRRSAGNGMPAAPESPSTSTASPSTSRAANRTAEVIEPQPSTSCESPQPSTSAMAYASMPPPAAPPVAQDIRPNDTPVITNDENADEHLDPMSQFEDEEGGFTVGDIYIPPPIKPYCSSESRGARLIITKIMNTNFKSYAQNVALGPFCHVSCVIIQAIANTATTISFIDRFRFCFSLNCSNSMRLLARMVAANPMSSIPCCLCLDIGRIKSVARNWR